ncbi:hypothetical protein RU97_GL000237 [Enterococcus canis]|uniref:Uncharacterized protein n=3 Tax=Enterococcus canis TaxID=214095 RepID=A0A1L8RJW6_9ENTE|nr:hypothetical protein RU97_GL000237 [Enterococcus canis]
MMEGGHFPWRLLGLLVLVGLLAWGIRRYNHSVTSHHQYPSASDSSDNEEWTDF